MTSSKQVSGKQVIHYRNYRRARDKALVRLAHLYPETYKQLLEEQRRFDEQEGKTWFANSDSNLSVGIHTRANLLEATTSTDYENADEGNNGGEA